MYAFKNNLTCLAVKVWVIGVCEEPGVAWRQLEPGLGDDVQPGAVKLPAGLDRHKDVSGDNVGPGE